MQIPQTLLSSPAWIATQEPSAWLTPSELAACQMPSSLLRRTDKTAGRIALKRLLNETFAVNPLTFSVGSEGPAPILDRWPGPTGLVVSLSHSGGWGAATWAWADAEETVGLDVQQVRPSHPGLTARIRTEAEQGQNADILLLWALKEAGIKARRRPWGRPLQEVSVLLNDPAASEGAAEIFVPGEPALQAAYARVGDLWIARAVRPRSVSSGAALPRSL